MNSKRNCFFILFILTILIFATVYFSTGEAVNITSVTEKPSFTAPLLISESFDLNNDGNPEKIEIQSTIGENIGEENTKILMNGRQNSKMTLIGYFDGTKVHTMNDRNDKILEVRTVSGHTVNATFFYYVENDLKIAPVSDANPPAFYGTATRNRPELKDVDNDGNVELITYQRFFPPEKKRITTIYEFTGEAFELSHSFEEKTTERFL